jgi:DeoR sensor domain-containing protein
MYRNNVMEAHLSKQMIEASQKVIVLSDSTKFGKRGFGRICGLDKVDPIPLIAAFQSTLLPSWRNLGRSYDCLNRYLIPTLITSVFQQ